MKTKKRKRKMHHKMTSRAALVRRACALRPAFASTKPIFKKTDAELREYIRRNQ